MVLVLFRSKTTPAAGDDYAAMAGELVARAKTLPGFVDLTEYVQKDGEHLLVIRWQDMETLKAWTDDTRHVIAQRLGREKWYEYFKVEVAEVARSYGFDRPAS